MERFSFAKSLEPYIAKEPDFAKDGYHKAMLDLGTSNGAVYGLPFAISLPVSLPCSGIRMAPPLRGFSRDRRLL